MKRARFDHYRDGLPELGSGDLYVFARERYDALLQEAEQYRAEHRPPVRQQLVRRDAGSPIAHLLAWIGILRARWRSRCLKSGGARSQSGVRLPQTTRGLFG